ncbi:MAG: LuxR C-terminal-related transcriptional regulator [Thermoleophilia bacterium]
MPVRSAASPRPVPAAGSASPPRPPARVPGEIPRRGLLERLRRDAARARVVVVSAPAGYGKTTLLAHMARAADLPVAWPALGPAHRSPRHLAGAIAEARAAAAPDPRAPVLLVLDDLDVIAGPALETVEAVLGDLPPGGRVALGCRAAPGLLLARRMVEGDLVHIGAGDLAFGAAEAEEFLARAGTVLTPDALAGLLERTEGWPAGLRLAAMRIGTGPDASARARAFAGDDRTVAAYLDEVVLGGLPPETRAFLTRTSILEPLDGDLCDAALGTTGSAARLLGLAGSGLMVVPLDDHGERYRYHRLLGDHLRRELGRGEPELIPLLRRRASRRHEERGEVEEAVRHALAAGDAGRAAGLAWRALPADLTRGGIDRLGATLALFDVDAVGASAPLATASAWFHAETRGDLAAHGLALAERALPPGDGAEPQVAAAVAALRALLARDGMAAMARDAAEGFRIASDDGPWRAYCRFLEGAARHLDGDLDGARALLADGIERAGLLAPGVRALCHAQMALVLLDEDEPVRGLMMARRGRAVVEEWGLGSQASAALVHAALGLALALSDDGAEARASLHEARRVLAGTVDASPWLGAEARVAMARAALLTGEAEIAGEALTDAALLMDRLPDAPLLRDEVERLSRQARPVPEGDAACLSSITAAEMRVLRLLPTHHPLREIGDLLFLSRFTVKSHAHSLYRKLGVTGRSEAVGRARELGLLGPDAGEAPGPVVAAATGGRRR